MISAMSLGNSRDTEIAFFFPGNGRHPSELPRLEMRRSLAGDLYTAFHPPESRHSSVGRAPAL